MLRRLSFMFAIVALLLMVAAARAQERPALVFFDCATAEEAEQVAELILNVTPHVSLLPGTCRWVDADQQARIIRLIKPVELSNGQIVWVGEIERYGRPTSFSVGFIELKLF